MKKKIKIFTERLIATLEHTVNEFAKDHNILDIQYQYAASDRNNFSHSVLIVYEEW